jgi:hypothetical protein
MRALPWIIAAVVAICFFVFLRDHPAIRVLAAILFGAVAGVAGMAILAINAPEKAQELDNALAAAFRKAADEVDAKAKK